jgi:hypothetical protein
LVAESGLRASIQPQFPFAVKLSPAKTNLGKLPSDILSSPF